MRYKTMINLELLRIKDYSIFKKKLVKYPHDSEKMTREYLTLFSKLLKNRRKIIKKRFLLKSPLYLFLNLVFLILKFRNIVKFVSKKNS